MDASAMAGAHVIPRPPGPLVGQAWNFLLELRLSEGVVGPERATAELLAWAAREGIAPPADPPTG